jgi:Cytochrome bd terminal oxidase subunit I
MGLALLIVTLKAVALRRKDDRYNKAARFWARMFAVNFLLGVVTGIPMEFQLGTNWSQLARHNWQHYRAAAGDGRCFFVFPGIGFPRAVSLWREPAFTTRSLGFRVSPFLLARGFRVSSSS